MNENLSTEEIISRIHNMIIERIENHEYLAGEMIPSERELSEMYGVSRSVVRSAIDTLVKHHYLERAVGKGTFVKKINFTKVAFGVLQESENSSFSSLIRKFGIENSNKLLGTGIISGSNYFAHRLHLDLNEEIFGIHRIRLGDNEAMALEYTYLPLHFFPDIQNYNFENLSLYDYMASKNHLPVNFQEVIRMQYANDRVKKALKIDADEEIISYIEITGYDHFGNLVEYTESYSKPFNLEVRFVTNTPI